MKQGIRSTIVVLAFSLAGCALAPGQRMLVEDGKSTVPVPLSDAAEPAIDTVTIIPITAQLVAGKVHAQLAADQSESRRLDRAARFPGGYKPYRIGARDVLSIKVWEHPELIGPEARFTEASGFVVREDGTLFYPLVGVVKAAGKTTEELRGILTQRLANYIESPQVDVQVATYRSQRVYVVGAVKTPGIQPVTDVPLTVVEAVNRAGGVGEGADMRNVTLTRGKDRFKIDLQALYEKADSGAQDVLLLNGDVLSVPSDNVNKVFVIGEVKKPSSVPMNDGQMTLTEALSEAGYIDPLTSNPGQIYVIRGGQAKPEIYHLDAKSVDALLLAERFALAPRDVVYVDTAAVTRWNRVISQIVPTAQLLYQGTRTF